MLKKGLLIVAVVAMLAGAAQAGEIKLHVWPCAFIPQDFMTIPVTMDIGYWIRVKDQNKIKIKLSQIDIHTYEGCVTFNVESNFNATLSASISAVDMDATKDGVQSMGKFSISTLTPTDVTLGTTAVKVCAKLTEANLGLIAGGTKDIQVANVLIKVVPTV
jgi:uncharacterized lipoprotein YajG